MLSSKLMANDNIVVAEPYSLFRTESWISSWLVSWENVLHEQCIPNNKYFYKIRTPFWKFGLRTAVPLGCSSTGIRSIRSEYFELKQESAEWFSYLGTDWQQLIIPDVDLDSSSYKSIKDFAASCGYFVQQRSVSTAYGIATQNNFQTYLSGLSQSARARLFNKRKKLEQMGRIVITNIWPDLDKFIELLNSFHVDRWGKPCYSHENFVFIKLFLSAIIKENGTVNLSVMTLDDQPISLLLDVEYLGRVYNFQAGFVEKLSNNIALGSLHLGYAIEAAFTNPSVVYYDFMAGQGKNTDYKAAFATQQQQLATLYVIKPAWLYWLYRLNDRIKS